VIRSRALESGSFASDRLTRATEEEWEHHRYAVRDLEAIEAKSGE